MATPQALSAVIRAARPDFKSTADKVAFAVHAIVSVNGFSLRKVGEGVDEAACAGAASLPSEEADIAGWNAPGAAEAEAGGAGGTYSFLYVPEAGAAPEQQGQEAPLLLLKCLRLDDDDGGPGGGGGGGGGGGSLLVSLGDVVSGRPPASRELRLDRFAASPAAPGAGAAATAGSGPGGPSYSYSHLDELIAAVEGALREALGGGGQGETKARTNAATATTTAAAVSGSGSSSAQQQDRQQGGRRGTDADAEEAAAAAAAAAEAERAERARRYGPPPGWRPPGIGDDDLMPGGLGGGLGGPLGGGLGGGGLGGVPLGPRGLGGGMHVGPENPIFADRLRHPRHPGMGGMGGPGFGPPGQGPPGGGVPGMRWDPISPEGLQGWGPDDFTREGRAQRGEGFNDIGRPPPGRGPDWDHMFG